MSKQYLRGLMGEYKSGHICESVLFGAYKEWCGMNESWFYSAPIDTIVELIADDIN